MNPPELDISKDSPPFADKLDAYFLKVEKANLRNTNLRWLALVLACFYSFGCYFCFDIPQALQAVLSKDLSITSFQFNLLYTVYSLPNIILPFFGGVLIDRMGVRISLSLFSLFLILGQLVSTFGAAKDDFILILIGRIIFGIGGESLNVAQSVIIANWFMGKEFAFALGATTCISRIGSSVNSFLSPKAYYWADGRLYLPFAIGAILCIFSGVCGLGLAYLDRKCDSELEEEIGEEQMEKFNVKDLKEFKLIFYLLLVNCCFLYGAFYGLNNNLNDLMVQRFGFSPQGAGNYIPIIYICATIITPLFGIFSDRFGKRVHIVLCGSILFFITHLVTAFLPQKGPGPNYYTVPILLGVGVFHATYAAVFWPCIPLVVNENLVGTAYGIVTAFYNLTLSMVPMLIGSIHDATLNKDHGYFWTQIALAGFTGIGIGFTVWIFFEDKKTGRKLAKPISAQDKHNILRLKTRSFGPMRGM